MIKSCLVCKKTIHKPSRLSKRDWVLRKKYCGNECKYKALHQGNIGRLTGKFRNCIECGKRFYIIQSQLRRRKTNGTYCSKECMWKSPVRNKKISGENQGNWKGGVTSKNHILRDKFRKSLQKKVFEKDDYTCQICHSKGTELHVDHIKSWANYPNLRFELSNCRTLCVKCHYELTFKRRMPPTTKKWGHNFKYCL